MAIVSPGYLTLLLTAAMAAVYGVAAHAQSGDGGEHGSGAAPMCAPALIQRPAALAAAPAAGDASPWQLEADTMEHFLGGAMTLRGGAVAQQGRRGLFADHIRYDPDRGAATAEGDVRMYGAAGDEIRADTMAVNMQTRAGHASGIRLTWAQRAPTATTGAAPGLTAPGAPPEFPEAGLRARAARMEFSPDQQQLYDATLTTCPPQREDVVVRARHLTFDYTDGVGTARAMRLEFKGVPLLYLPRATFPIDDRRKSGFLFPRMGYVDGSGWMVAAPYYLNLAPHYDVTLTPRLLSRRGAQLEGEFRHLSATGRGRWYGELLPSDDAYGNRDRYLYGVNQRHRWGNGWRVTIAARATSDADYVRDFSDDREWRAASHLVQRAEVDYFGEGLRLRGRVEIHDPQAADATHSPYEILPEGELHWARPVARAGTAGVDARYTRFADDSGERVHGARWRIAPYLALPFTAARGYVTPRFSVQAIGYRLEDAAPGTDIAPEVAVPVFSLDSGLSLRRPIVHRGIRYTQTLEPRLYYLNIPARRAQDAFPTFDSGGGGESSFAHYFRDNRFFGGDRIGDAHQVTVGLTSRLLAADSGRQYVRLSVGQIFHLRDRRIQLAAESGAPAPADTADTSDFLTELSADFPTASGARWRAEAFARWDDGAAAVARSELHYQNDRIHGSLAYTLERDAAAAEQLHLSFAAPLGALWHWRGNVAYALHDHRLHSASLGLRYDGCCWGAGLRGVRSMESDGTQQNRFIITLELAPPRRTTQ